MDPQELQALLKNNPVAFITDKITEGVNHAVEMLDNQNLMIASATLHFDLEIHIPGLPIPNKSDPDLIKVTNNLTIVVGPNPYKVNQ
jgi:hypothetical protein